MLTLTTDDISAIAKATAAELVRLQTRRDTCRWNGQDLAELKRIQHQKLMEDGRQRRAKQ